MTFIIALLVTCFVYYLYGQSSLYAWFSVYIISFLALKGIVYFFKFRQASNYAKMDSYYKKQLGKILEGKE
jgi:hypothetical protein